MTLAEFETMVRTRKAYYAQRPLAGFIAKMDEGLAQNLIETDWARLYTEYIQAQWLTTRIPRKQT